MTERIRVHGDFLRRLAPVLAALVSISISGLPGELAQAGVVLRPVGASTNMGSLLSSAPEHVIDQSGLTTPYTSGVTDFDAYIALNPIHHAVPGSTTIWISSQITGNFDFDLGGTHVIESFALWNRGFNVSTNLRGFELLADDDLAFASPVSLGSFNADPNTGPITAVLPEVFAFAPTSAAYLRMVITSNNGGNSVIFSEAAFQANPVPEPASVGLAAIGAIGPSFVAIRRRTRMG